MDTPNFCKTQTFKKVHFISNFRNLNKQLKLKPYPMPNINEILLK